MWLVSEPGDLGLDPGSTSDQACAAGVSHLSEGDSSGMSPTAPWGSVDEPMGSG